MQTRDEQIPRDETPLHWLEPYDGDGVTKIRAALEAAVADPRQAAVVANATSAVPVLRMIKGHQRMRAVAVSQGRRFLDDAVVHAARSVWKSAPFWSAATLFGQHFIDEHLDTLRDEGQRRQLARDCLARGVDSYLGEFVAAPNFRSYLLLIGIATTRTDLDTDRIRRALAAADDELITFRAAAYHDAIRLLGLRARSGAPTPHEFAVMLSAAVRGTAQLRLVSADHGVGPVELRQQNGQLASFIVTAVFDSWFDIDPAYNPRDALRDYLSNPRLSP
ncbi:hypothetical protein [Cumulibacter manganitolerans]|uniref:hypothetical protein n=1 Tax=Cumulibacter manganitolerans TaxID=1884992 RepID=UPI001294BB11|nr:hypothetical protein [Cumulibacter manganitolerans]